MEGYLEIFGRKFGGKKEDFVEKEMIFFGSGNTAVYINLKFIVLCAIMGEMNDDFSTKVV